MARDKADGLTFGAKNAESDRRLGELALYVAQKCANDPHFGATKLNKTLWWADFLRFGECGQSITGAQYQALEYGPAPKRWMSVRTNLIEAGDAKVTEVSLMGHTQKRFVALREPDLSLFSEEELAMVDRVIEQLEGQNAREASDGSHGRAWEISRKREDLLIPYEAVFLSDRKPDDYDRQRAAQLAQRHGW